jgi:hypothetical protein
MKNYSRALAWLGIFIMAVTYVILFILYTKTMLYIMSVFILAGFVVLAVDYHHYASYYKKDSKD